MSCDELSFYIDNIREFNPPIFSAVPHQWTQSRYIRACLLRTRYVDWRRHHKDFEELAKLMLSVHLEKEPGYSHILCYVANEYRDEERVRTSADTGATLFQEYVKVQEQGSPGHFLGVVGLASTLMLSSFHSGAAVTLAASLETLREALPSSASDWMKVRKTVILGRILNDRVRHFSASNDALAKSIPILTCILDLLPPQPPSYVSILELLVVSTALALSQRLSAKDWHDAITMLAKGLQLYVTSNVASSDGEPDSSKPYTEKEKLDTLNLLFSDGLGAPSRFTLELEAMCLIHMADVFRFSDFDVSHRPQSLPLSFMVYRRSLRLPLSGKVANDAFLESDLKRAWEDEREALRKAITAHVHHTILPVNSLPKSSYTFEYRVLRKSNTNLPDRKCIFRYYPMEGHEETFRAARSFFHKMQGKKVTCLPWPEELISLPASSDSSVPGLPTSSMIPGIDKFLSSNENVLSLPLEQRTIKAILRYLGFKIRQNENLNFDATEFFINDTSRRFYMDASEVVLGTRMRGLKNGSAHIARGPIQALISKGPEKCLELVDRSRALFWTRLLRLRTSFDGLPEALAHQLQETAIQLDHCKGQVNSGISKDEAREQMKLETSFERLVDQVRDIPGFKDFLRPKTYDILMTVASEGPVVVLIGNSSTYAAVLIRQSDIDAIYLSTLTENVLENLLIGIQQANRTSRSIFQEEVYVPGQERAGKPKNSARSLPPYEKMLGGLWQHIAKPVLDRLGATSVRVCSLKFSSLSGTW